MFLGENSQREKHGILVIETHYQSFLKEMY